MRIMLFILLVSALADDQCDNNEQIDWASHARALADAYSPKLKCKKSAGVEVTQALIDALGGAPVTLGDSADVRKRSAALCHRATCALLRPGATFSDAEARLRGGTIDSALRLGDQLGNTPRPQRVPSAAAWRLLWSMMTCGEKAIARSALSAIPARTAA